MLSGRGASHATAALRLLHAGDQHAERPGDRVAAASAGLTVFVPPNHGHVLVLHCPSGHRADAHVQKTFKGLAATDPAALRRLLDQIEDRLGFVSQLLIQVLNGRRVGLW